MNEVCNLTALYIFYILFSYYNHINFAKCDDISVILEFSVSVIKKNNCIDFNCTVEDIIVVNRSCQRVIENNFCKYMYMMYRYLDNEMSEE